MNRQVLCSEKITEKGPVFDIYVNVVRTERKRTAACSDEGQVIFDRSGFLPFSNLLSLWHKGGNI